jgi:hypothetical protein
VTPRLEVEDLGKKAVVGCIGQYPGICLEKIMKSPTSQGEDGHIPNRNYKQAFPKTKLRNASRTNSLGRLSSK